MQGLHLSSVQSAAVELLLLNDERLKVENFVERFKLSVVSANPSEWLPKMFPEWIRQPEEQIEDTDDLDLSDTEGTWIFEQQDVTPEEAERAFAEALAEAGGTLTFEDLSADEGWE